MSGVKHEALAEAESVYTRHLNEDLDAIVCRLRDMGAKLALLFGSAARGRRDLFTDLDLLVVLPSDLPFVERTGALYRQLGARVDVASSPIPRPSSRPCRMARSSRGPRPREGCSMRGDPKAEGSRWLEQAREDLKWAEMLAREGGFHVACFLAQQVAEKALKAYLYGAGEPVVPLNRKVAILAAEIREREGQLTGTRRANGPGHGGRA